MRVCGVPALQALGTVPLTPPESSLRGESTPQARICHPAQGPSASQAGVRPASRWPSPVSPSLACPEPRCPDTQEDTGRDIPHSARLCLIVLHAGTSYSVPGQKSSKSTEEFPSAPLLLFAYELTAALLSR